MCFQHSTSVSEIRIYLFTRRLHTVTESWMEPDKITWSKLEPDRSHAGVQFGLIKQLPLSSDTVELNAKISIVIITVLMVV